MLCAESMITSSRLISVKSCDYTNKQKNLNGDSVVYHLLCECSDCTPLLTLQILEFHVPVLQKIKDHLTVLEELVFMHLY